MTQFARAPATPTTIVGPITITGPIDVILDAVPAFQTSQKAVGSSAVQLTPSPLAGRKAISIKATTANSGDIVYIGNSAAVTSSTGYALYDGDSLQMDLGPGQAVWAIASGAGQTLFILELGG